MTDLDRRMLDVAGQRWNLADRQAVVVEAEFGVTVTRFWQIVNRILDSPEAHRSTHH